MPSAEILRRFRSGHRRRATRGEAAVIAALQDCGWSFKFQVILGPYIVDLVIPDRLAVIEVDGPSHAATREKDARRDAFLRRCGFTVVRVTNDEAVNGSLRAIFSLVAEPDWEPHFRSALAKASSMKSRA